MAYFNDNYHPTMFGERVGPSRYRILNALTNVEMPIPDSDASETPSHCIENHVVPGSCWASLDTIKNELPGILRVSYAGAHIEAQQFSWEDLTFGPTGYVLPSSLGLTSLPLNRYTFSTSYIRLWAPDEVPRGPSPFAPLNPGPYFLPRSEARRVPLRMGYPTRLAPKTYYDLLLED